VGVEGCRWAESAFKRAIRFAYRDMVDASSARQTGTARRRGSSSCSGARGERRSHFTERTAAGALEAELDSTGKSGRSLSVPGPDLTGPAVPL